MHHTAIAYISGVYLEQKKSIGVGIVFGTKEGYTYLSITLPENLTKTYSYNQEIIGTCYALLFSLQKASNEHINDIEIYYDKHKLIEYLNNETYADPFCKLFRKIYHNKSKKLTNVQLIETDDINRKHNPLVQEAFQLASRAASTISIQAMHAPETKWSIQKSFVPISYA